MTAETDQILAIYKLYPRRVGRIAALSEINKAVAFLVKTEGMDALDARRTLYKAVLAYARSPEGQNPDKTKVPHPRTWFHQGRYLDDPKEWQHGGFTNGSIPASKADRNLGILAKIINEGKHSGSDGEDGELQTSQRGRNNAQKLLLGH